MFEGDKTFYANYKDPPNELFHRISFPDIKRQYVTLRNVFIPELLSSPESAQCWIVRAVCVKIGQDEFKIPLSRVKLPHDNRVENLWSGMDTSLESGSNALVGKSVLVLPAMGSRPVVGGSLGEMADGSGMISGTISGFEKTINEVMLYKLLMTQEYSYVKTAEIWHILRLYHRLYMGGATTEAMAETVGSLLTQRTAQNGDGMCSV